MTTKAQYEYLTCLKTYLRIILESTSQNITHFGTMTFGNQCDEPTSHAMLSVTISGIDCHVSGAEMLLSDRVRLNTHSPG